MRNRKPNILKLLYRYIKSLWPSFTLLAIIMGGSITLQLISPQVIRHFIDSALAQEPLNNLIAAVLIFLAITVFQQLLGVFTSYLCQNIGWSATNSLRKDLLLHFMSLDMEFHKKHQSGEMIERLDEDVNNLFDFFSTLILKIISNLLIIIGIIIVLLRENWIISLSLFLYALISIVVLRRFQNIGTKHWLRSAEARAKFYGFLKEQIDNVKDVRTSGATQNSLYKYLVMVRNLYKETIRANMVYPILWSTSTMIFAIGTALSLGVGVYMWSRNIITIGTVYLIYSYADLMSSPIMQLRDNLGKLQQSEASVLRIQEIFDMEPKLTCGNQNINGENPVALEVRNLSFQYEKDGMILKNISFKLDPGKVLGIVGKTGSGKTTLVKLIARLQDPQRGEILVDGINIKEIKDESVRKNIAYVTQDVHLYHGTIRDNLTFYDESIDDDCIYKAIVELGLKEWIDKMPRGLDTVIHSTEKGFSSGEAQLLSIIRVFLKNPSLIILDEASSRLDPVTERHISMALSKIMSGRSVIVIAHKLSTLNYVDNILILKDGEITEHGRRDELLRTDSSLYGKLVKKGIEEVLA